MIKNNKKSILTSIILSLCMIVSNFSFVTFLPGSPLAGKSYGFDYTGSSKTITNSNFAQSTQISVDNPGIPTSWTYTLPETERDELTGAEYGVITTAEGSTWWGTGLTNPDKANPESTDTNTLLISKGTNEEADGIAFGYKTSSTIELSENSYYLLRLSVKTIGVGTKATVAISGAGLDAQYKNINTADKWEPVSFYIEVPPEGTSNVFKINIELWLGYKDAEVTENSNGAVFFDELTMQQITSYDYLNQKLKISEGGLVDLTYFADSREVVPTANGIIGGDFENDDFTTWAVLNGVVGESFTRSLVDEASEFQTENEDSPGTYTPADISFIGTYTSSPLSISNQILKMTNFNNTAVGFKTNMFVIEQFTSYRVRIFMKSNNTSAKVSLAIYGYANSGKVTTKSSSQSGTTPGSSGMTVYNGWKEYCFYIKGSPLGNREAYLQFTIDTASTVYFDDILVEKVDAFTYTTANSNSSGTNGSYKMDLSDTVETATVTNGTFNVTGDTTAYIGPKVYESPLYANSWTQTEHKEAGETKDVISGIVGGHTDFNTYTSAKMAPIKTLANPNYDTTLGEFTDFRNMLLIHSASPVKYGYASGDISVSSSKYQKISVAVYTTGTTKASIYLYAGSQKTLAFKEIQTNDTWEIYHFYVKTSTISKTLTLKINLGNEVTASDGTVFFKNIINVASSNNEITELSKKSIAELLAVKSAIADYSVDNFTMHSDKKDDDGLYESYSYTTNSGSTGKTGIIDSTGSFTDTPFEDIDDIDSVPTDAKNILVLHNGDSNKHTTVQRTYKETLTVATYYKVSFYVRTVDVANGSFYVSFNGLSKGFNSINTETAETTENGYVKYTLLLYTGENSISNFYITFGLGKPATPVKGTVFISEVTITSITESVFKETKVNLTPASSLILDLTPASKLNASKNPLTETEKWTIFFVVLSSLLLVGAIIVAMVAVGVKKLPKHRTVIIREGFTGSSESTRNKSGDGFI